MRCIETLLADPGIDTLLLQEELPRAPGTERKESNLRAVNEIAARAGKPIAFVTMISHGLTDYSRTLRAGAAECRVPAGDRQIPGRGAFGDRLCRDAASNHPPGPAMTNGMVQSSRSRD